jgi:hypothetical protein
MFNHFILGILYDAIIEMFQDEWGLDGEIGNWSSFTSFRVECNATKNHGDLKAIVKRGRVKGQG